MSKGSESEESSELPAKRSRKPREIYTIPDADEVKKSKREAKAPFQRSEATQPDEAYSHVLVVEGADSVAWHLGEPNQDTQEWFSHRCFAIHCPRNVPPVTKLLDMVKDEFALLHQLFGEQFCNKYLDQKSSSGGGTRADATSKLGSVYGSKSPTLYVTKILGRRVLHEETFNAESRQSDPVQEFFHVQAHGMDTALWVRIGDIANVSECFQVFFAQELLATLLRLHSMVGLQSVKAQVAEIRIDMQASQMRRRAEVKTKQERHIPLFAFVGNPGTGKTTVAEFVGKMYWLIGDLQYGHTCFWTAGNLKAGYEGQTPLKTAWAIGQAKGGVFFLDEAYALVSTSGEGGFGQEALDVVTGLTERSKTECGLIVAGYEKEMDARFFGRNPGLRSRIDSIHFHDYTSTELCEIAHRHIESSGFHFAVGASEAFKVGLQKQHPFWPLDSGNARAVKLLVHWMVQSLNKYVVTSNCADATKMCALRIEDVTFCLAQQSARIVLHGQQAEKLASLTRALGDCETAASVYEKEADIRELLFKFLPPVPNEQCPYCEGTFVRAGVAGEAYCTQCFYRVSACHQCQGEVLLPKGMCRGCGEMVAPLFSAEEGKMLQRSPEDSMGKRISAYGALLSKLNPSLNEPSATDVTDFYVLMNRLACLLALKSGAILPGEKERQDAFQFFSSSGPLFKDGTPDDELTHANLKRVRVASLCDNNKELELYQVFVDGQAYFVQHELRLLATEAAWPVFFAKLHTEHVRFAKDGRSFLATKESEIKVPPGILKLLKDAAIVEKGASAAILFSCQDANLKELLKIIA